MNDLTKAPSTDPAVVLVNAVITAYHTTRLSDCPVATHVLSKHFVQKALAEYAKMMNDRCTNCSGRGTVGGEGQCPTETCSVCDGTKVKPITGMAAR